MGHEESDLPGVALVKAMNFETNSDVLDWYERQPRTLTPEFVNAIP
jgi:hypothetical protein